MEVKRPPKQTNILYFGDIYMVCTSFRRRVKYTNESLDFFLTPATTHFLLFVYMSAVCKRIAPRSFFNLFVQPTAQQLFPILNAVFTVCFIE